MAKKKAKDKVGSSGRFGPRYGTRVRTRVREVEDRAKGYHRCPECGAKKVKRVGSGIWECNRCGAKFAAKASTPQITPLEKVIASEAEELEEPEVSEKQGEE